MDLRTVELLISSRKRAYGTWMDLRTVELLEVFRDLPIEAVPKYLSHRTLKRAARMRLEDRGKFDVMVSLLLQNYREDVESLIQGIRNWDENKKARAKKYVEDRELLNAYFGSLYPT